MAGIDLSRLDDVMEAVSGVRLRVGHHDYGTDPAGDHAAAIRDLAEAVADLADVVRDKLAECAAVAAEARDARGG